MEKEKKDFIIYQWLFFIPFSVLAMLGALITSFFALFIFICGAKYIVASFMLETSKIFPAIVLTIIALAVVAVLIFFVILIIKKYIKAVDNFKEEKKALFDNNSNSDENQN